MMLLLRSDTMTNLKTILGVLLLSGCSLFPTKREFPPVPNDLKERCPNLKATPPTTKLSEVISVVKENYSEYHECAEKVDSWNEWYDKQKKIYDSVK